MLKVLEKDRRYCGKERAFGSATLMACQEPELLSCADTNGTQI